MLLPITIIPTPSLRRPSTALSTTELAANDHQELIASMVPTMYAEEGIGLAAPQVAKNIRLCVVGKDAIPVKMVLPDRAKANARDLVLVNPRYEMTSRKTTVDTEGCLSVPGYYGKVKRARDILVHAWNEQGEPISFEAHGFLARVVQHEIDHLDGVLFIDRARDLYKIEHRKHLEPQVVLDNIKRLDV